MLDLSPIANAIKSVQAPPPQAQPSVTEEMKPVPQAEIDHAVPPLPVKGGEPGLGEHLDLYDTQASQNPPAQKDPPVLKDGSGHAAPENAPGGILPAQTTFVSQSEAAKKEKPAVKVELLIDKRGLPPPSTEPPHAELPFLTPLGGKTLGQAIDARI